VRLFGKAPAPTLRNTVDNGGRGLPLTLADDMHIELTVEQAIFCIIAQTVTTPMASKAFHTTRSIQKQLKIAFGVEVSLRHVQFILKRWKDLDVICEMEQLLKLRVPIHGPKTIYYQLKHPEKIFTVKKWKGKKGV